MSLSKKIIAIAIIATFLATIPLAFAQNQPEYRVVINELRVNDNYAKSSDGPGGGKPTANAYILLGIKWPTAMLPLTLYVNDVPTGSLLSSVSAGAAEWDANTAANLFTQPIATSDLVAETDRPDIKNEVMFGGRINNDPNIIGVTYTWYNVRKQIVDFDMVLNNVDYSWGDFSGVADVMDVQNIVTHELGHGLGLADLYETNRNYDSTTWPLQTMWGYSWEGDVIKRTLDSGDKAGIQKLYGQ